MNEAVHALPPSPVYVFRGHVSPIASVFSGRAVWYAGDQDGYVSAWHTETKRAWAVWRAHDGAVLKVEEWQGLLLTMGRDNRLIFWNLNLNGTYDTRLPVEGDVVRQKPWMEHIVDVNATTFCGFALLGINDGLCFAVPHTQAVESIDIYAFHPLVREATALTPNEKTGSVMALAFAEDNLVAGFENGSVHFYRKAGSWQLFWSVHIHRDTVLSLACHENVVFSSSADAILAKMLIRSQVEEHVNCHHSGQQGLAIRGDGKILVTAGWDGKGRVFSTKSMQMLAILKFHEGALACAFTKDGILLGGKDGKISLWSVF
jgi:WD40 repeat protein